MKTEDDTFRVLTQSSFEYVKKQLRRNEYKIIDFSLEEMEAFLLTLGWTLAEYDKRNK